MLYKKSKYWLKLDSAYDAIIYTVKNKNLYHMVIFNGESIYGTWKINYWGIEVLEDAILAGRCVPLI